MPYGALKCPSAYTRNLTQSQGKPNRRHIQCRRRSYVELASFLRSSVSDAIRQSAGWPRAALNASELPQPGPRPWSVMLGPLVVGGSGWRSRARPRFDSAPAGGPVPEDDLFQHLVADQHHGGELDLDGVLGRLLPSRRTGNAPCSPKSPSCRNRIAPWPRGSMYQQRQRPSPGAEDLVWDARLAQDSKIVCFFQAAHKFNARLGEVRLQRRGQPRRRHHVADRLRADRADAADAAEIAALVKQAAS
jgi:hypothetical protein